MAVTKIAFEKAPHQPVPMTSTLGEDVCVLTCLELSCENSVQTMNLQQDCQGVCHGNLVVLTCAENCEGEWQKL